MNCYITNSNNDLVPFFLELAISNEQKKIGLMHRSYLSDRHGMLFIYDEPYNSTIWMKNTEIPLDILFIDENFIINCIKYGKPFDETIVSCNSNIKYVIELSYGTCAKYSIVPGSKLII
jgi:uncharacterized membrane protein (UPF0127 family)